MKVYKKLTVIIITMFLLTSCDDMMDLHKEFIKDGETVYMPKPDSVKFLAGKNRIYFECVLLNATNVTSVDIFWNRGDSSYIIPVTPGAGIYRVSAWIPNMGEQSYTFEVQTSDAYGQHSLKTPGFANSYGDLFQESLVNRPYRSFALTDNNKNVSVVLSWIAAAEGLVLSEIRYNDDDDDTTTIRALPLENTTTCEKAMVNSTFEYRSAFLPESEAVDTFYTGWKQIIPDPNYTLGMNGWTATASSFEGIYDVWGPPESIFQDGFEQVWHTSFSAVPPPYWVEIDMQNLKNITRLEVLRYTDIKTLHVIASETQVIDKSALGNMTPVATLEYPGPWNLRNEMRYCDFEPPLIARYIYFYITDIIDSSRRKYASIESIKLFGWTQ